MYTIQTYHFCQSAEEAYELLQKNRNNTILAGGAWLRMTRRPIATALDLSRIPEMSAIGEEEGELVIGAGASLRAIETHPLTRTYAGGALRRALEPIVGVQLRRAATIGGNICSRHGFSDPITVLLALGAQLDLVGVGRLPLEEFLQGPPLRDVLRSVRLPSGPVQAAYLARRSSATDLATLTVATACREGEWRVAVGARPGCAAVAPNASRALTQGADSRTAGEIAAAELAFGSSMRGSAAYRRLIAAVLVQRCADLVKGEL